MGKQIGDVNISQSKMKAESKIIKDQLRKLKQIVDDDRQTIKHLNQQRNAMKAERDESFALLAKMDEKHSAKFKKEKNKHKSELEKLSSGFLQSLGAEPGKDVMTVIKELKAENVSLKKNVDELAETLARKSQSLLDALEAVHNMNDLQEEAVQRRMSLINEVQPSPITPRSGGGKMKNKVKAFHQRMRSKDLNKKQSIDLDLALKNGKLPKPPKRRNSQVGLNGYSLTPKKGPHHRPTATFFKKAVGNQSAN